jgi:hypothetical protein
MSSGSSSNLNQAARLLNIEWERARESWRDLRSIEFYEKYLADLPGQITMATTAMEEMDVLLKKVRTDCE